MRIDDRMVKKLATKLASDLQKCNINESIVAAVQKSLVTITESMQDYKYIAHVYGNKEITVNIDEAVNVQVSNIKSLLSSAGLKQSNQKVINATLDKIGLGITQYKVMADHFITESKDKEDKEDDAETDLEDDTVTKEKEEDKSKDAAMKEDETDEDESKETKDVEDDSAAKADDDENKAMKEDEEDESKEVAADTKEQDTTKDVSEDDEDECSKAEQESEENFDKNGQPENEEVALQPDLQMPQDADDSLDSQILAKLAELEKQIANIVSVVTSIAPTKVSEVDNDYKAKIADIISSMNESNDDAAFKEFDARYNTSLNEANVVAVAPKVEVTGTAKWLKYF